MKPQGTLQELGWNGLRFQSADQLHVAQFKRDGFVFSRLRPYQTWEQFEEEAKRLWKLHVHPHPKPPRDLDLPFLNFLYRETLVIPGHNYGINLTRTLQICQNPTLEGAGIILDIDVSTMQPFPPDPQSWTDD